MSAFGLLISSRENAVLLKSLRLFTIIMVALCLVPTGAHFFELINKMSLSPVAYMTVQKIYASNYNRAPHLDPCFYDAQ